MGQMCKPPGQACPGGAEHRAGGHGGVEAGPAFRNSLLTPGGRPERALCSTLNLMPWTFMEQPRVEAWSWILWGTWARRSQLPAGTPPSDVGESVTSLNRSSTSRMC